MSTWAELQWRPCEWVEYSTLTEISIWGTHSEGGPCLHQRRLLPQWRCRATQRARQQKAKFKLPERLEVVDAFPLTSVGKVSKKDLREDINRKLAAEAARG